MSDLNALGERIGRGLIYEQDPGRAFRLISRRSSNVYNSTGVHLETLKKPYGYNPAYLNEDDLRQLGLAPGDRVRIFSNRSEIVGIVEVDSTLRPGVVSMSHAWGGTADRDDEARKIGSNTNRLMTPDDGWDRYCGIPTMSNLPVDIVPFPE